MEAHELAEIIRETVSREVAQRMDGLCAAFDGSIKAIQPGRDGKDGIDGKPGQDGAPGEKGADGMNGNDGQPGLAGKDGAPGADGKNGSDGLNGKDGAAGENGVPGLHGKDGEPGEKGTDGINGRDGAPGERGEKGIDGRDGVNGKDGSDGLHGKDGHSVTLDEIRPIFEGEVAKWALDFERRATDTLQKAIDRMPVPKDGRDGIDGKDGVSLESFEFKAVDGGRVFRFEAKAGDTLVAREVTTGLALDRGTYKAGTAYETGDGVTYGGSWWLAQKSTSEAPGSQSGDWRLVVKRGRDGKDAA